MAETGVSLAGFREKNEKRTRSLFELIEFGSRLVAAALALTYVSGYLVSTTYLSTYGIATDASELIRAKYIYVGFQYLLSVIAFGVVARVVAVALDSPKRQRQRSLKDDWIARWREDDAIDAERHMARGALKMRMLPDNPRNQRGHFRQVRIAALILFLFAIEIMLVTPGTFLVYLPLQALFLLTIALYQTSFYRELSSRSYGWGNVYGRDMVDRMRNLYGLKIGLIIEMLLFAEWVSHRVNILSFPGELGTVISWLVMIARWSFSIVTFSYILGGACFTALSAETLKILDSRKKIGHSALFPMLGLPFIVFSLLSMIFHGHRKNKGNFRHDLKKSSLRRVWVRLCPWQKYVSSFRVLRWENTTAPVLVGAFCFCSLSVLLGARHLWLVAILDYGALALALIILSNLLVLSCMHFKKHEDLKVRYSINWHTWVLISVEGGVLYLVSVFGFSYLVYPFLPLEKAGGEYLSAYAITVNVNHAESGCSSAALDTTFELHPLNDQMKNANSELKFVVLDEDPNWLYLAPSDGSDAGGGPSAWKWWAMCDEYYANPKAHEVCRPRVYAVNRRCIANTKSF